MQCMPGTPGVKAGGATSGHVTINRYFLLGRNMDLLFYIVSQKDCFLFVLMLMHPFILHYIDIDIFSYCP